MVSNNVSNKCYVALFDNIDSVQTVVCRGILSSPNPNRAILLQSNIQSNVSWIFSFYEKQFNEMYDHQYVNCNDRRVDKMC